MLDRWTRLASLAILFAATLLAATMQAQRVASPPAAREDSPAQTLVQTKKATDVMSALIAHERESYEHRNMYTYLSYERSERTGNRLWAERVVECPQGHIRKLTAIDGVALTPEQEAAERGRLAEILKDPAAFEKHEQERMRDESHARQMVQLLDKAFLFDAMHVEGEDVRIDFKPNPDYQPKSMEERVLHGMTGSVTFDPKVLRIRKIDAHLPQDVSIGFGILGTVHAGTQFISERAPFESGEWKTRGIDTHIDARALFFKTMSKNEHAVHDHFERVPNNLTLEQAVARAEQ